MGRAPCCDKANVKKGPWSPEEDAKLKDYIEKYGTGGNWIALPQKIGLKRCGKSCRLRWLNYLRPNIKHGGFSEEEDNIILSLYISIGSRWSIIAAQLPGRTDNDVKNYWNTRLKKKLLGRRKEMMSHRGSSDQFNSKENKRSSEILSNSALERLQLHMQLRDIQNPLSFYNNPVLWPKLTQLLQPTNKIDGYGIPVVNPALFSSTEQEQGRSSLEPNCIQEVPISSGGFQGDYSRVAMNVPTCLENVSSVNGMSSSSDGNFNMPGAMLVEAKAESADQSQVSSIQADLDGFPNDKKQFPFGSQEDLFAEFDCMRELARSNGSMPWWPNELDAKSASPSSWDSASVMNQEDLFYDQLQYDI